MNDTNHIADDSCHHLEESFEEQNLGSPLLNDVEPTVDSSESTSNVIEGPISEEYYVSNSMPDDDGLCHGAIEDTHPHSDQVVNASSSIIPGIHNDDEPTMDMSGRSTNVIEGLKSNIVDQFNHVPRDAECFHGTVQYVHPYGSSHSHPEGSLGKYDESVDDSERSLQYGQNDKPHTRSPQQFNSTTDHTYNKFLDQNETTVPLPSNIIDHNYIRVSSEENQPTSLESGRTYLFLWICIK
ncbi:hypothetical protein QAD02_003221 [Eretmocerus hayati]|uniref:Uncharacterized protein n=1 Tax=Eretmocerus hayati TaxID=131215 RepID=A0ACC2NLL2_9HYME|nr:hypothetical protein QAD02_003221 [Eretmocerus hayati]